MPVNLQPDGELANVVYLIRGDQPGANRPEAVAALALVPLPVALQLEVPFRHIVDHAVARYVVECVLLTDVDAALADHNPQFHFPVEFGGAFRFDHGVIGAAHGAGPLVEHHGLNGHWRAGFVRVVLVVEADADELADVGDAGADTLFWFEQGQRLNIELGNRCQALGRQRVAADIIHNLGEVSRPTLLVQNGWLLAAGFPYA